MRIGLIARADNTGLGVQSKGFFDHIQCKALVIDSSQLLLGQSRDILRPRMDRFPGQYCYQLKPGTGMHGGIPRPVINDFLKDIDVLFCMETPYDYNIFTACAERGIRIILQLNYEFLDYPSDLPSPDLFAAPSPWYFENIPNQKKLLPVPVDTRHFTPRLKPKTFVHIAGRPAVNDRNGTAIFLQSLMYVKNEITVEIFGQRPISYPVMSRPNVKINCLFGDKEEYYDNYNGGVLVLPRRYGGLCLPFNEAIGAEMPVITTDVSPNNTWLPQEWLVPAETTGVLRAKKAVQVVEADPQVLAAKIDEFCDDQFYFDAVSKARKIKNDISWQTLYPLYYKTLNDIL
jgi:hypothetical protein